MTLDEATTRLNAMALRFAEFAIDDRAAIASWEEIVVASFNADVKRNAIAHHTRRAERNEADAKAITHVLLELSALTEEKTNGSRPASVTPADADPIGAEHRKRLDRAFERATSV